MTRLPLREGGEEAPPGEGLWILSNPLVTGDRGLTGVIHILA